VPIIFFAVDTILNKYTLAVIFTGKIEELEQNREEEIQKELK